jgi:DNA-binding transcriptional MerR regulator
LRDTGFNVSEIASALRNWDDEFITEQLIYKRREIENAIRAEQGKLSKIELAIKDIRREKIAFTIMSP